MPATDSMKVDIYYPKRARELGRARYLGHRQFIEYCKECNVRTSPAELEQYERSRLLSPCARLVWPTLLLRRWRRAWRDDKATFEERPEWAWFTKYGDHHSSGVVAEWPYYREAHLGHPLERTLGGEFTDLDVRPASQPRRRWKSYDIIIERAGKTPIRQSRAEHFYAPWKVFAVHDLQRWNTELRPTIYASAGQRKSYDQTKIWLVNTMLNWRFLARELRPGQPSIQSGAHRRRTRLPSSLLEWEPWFDLIAAFAWRRERMRQQWYSYEAETRAIGFSSLEDALERASRPLIEIASALGGYGVGLQFLRALVHLDTVYTALERYVIRQELRRLTAAAVRLFAEVSGKTFPDVSGDYEGPSRGSRAALRDIDGQTVYVGRMAEMFPTEEWELDTELRDSFLLSFERFNDELLTGERMPERLGEDLFEVLRADPSWKALHAILEVQRATFGDEGRWQLQRVWNGIAQLSIAVEDHGREWLAPHARSMEGCLDVAFPGYAGLRDQLPIRALGANTPTELVSKIRVVRRHCSAAGLQGHQLGEHVPLAQLGRNFFSHRRSYPSPADFQEVWEALYSSLVRTLFALFARRP